MAKSRRKSGGATRGRIKPKKMGKGWSTMRRQRGSEKPVQRTPSESGTGAVASEPTSDASGQ